MYQDDIQFKIVSRSQQYKPQQDNISSSLKNSKNNPLPVINDDSDIFNDINAGGGVEPSIDESIRDTIRCSFVSSEYGEITREMSRKPDSQNDQARDKFVMNRMNWITYLKVLFDQLESFNQNKQKHVENINFINALKRIKNLLPLQHRNEYYKSCSDVAFTYQEVEQGVQCMPKYVTWDMVIDVFLSKNFSQVNNPRESKAFQQRELTDFNEPEGINDSQISDIVDFKDDNEVESFYRKGIGKQNPQVQSQQKQSYVSQSNQLKKSTNEAYSLSFADSVIKNQNFNHYGSQVEQQPITLAQAPLLMEKEEDEACEIDSDNDNSQMSGARGSRNDKQKLEESVRSSRTATFKSVRNGGAYGGGQFINNITNNTISSISNHTNNTTLLQAQDSYYNIASTSKKPPAHYQVQQNIYYQQQIQQPILISGTKHESSLILDNQSEDQVEIGIVVQTHQTNNHSRNSSRKKNDRIILTQEEMRAENEKQSTRISSFNSNIKNQNTVNNMNSTILSQNSNNSAANSSKLSHASQQSKNQYSNLLDIDESSKGWKVFDVDLRVRYGENKTLRSINLATNALTKVPNLEKSLQYMNLSFNKLKSLNGIESCINLKFLNVMGNQIASAQNIIILQSLRELIFAYNSLTGLKEISQLKNLNLLDVSNNKIMDFEKIIPLQQLKKLQTLKLMGNPVVKMNNYEPQVMKLVPSLRGLDPDLIRDFSQFSQLENICFGGEGPMILIEQMSNQELKVKESMSETKDRERSKTPTTNIRERNKSQLGQTILTESKMKSTVISPNRQALDQLLHQKLNVSSSKAKNQTNAKMGQLQAQFTQQVKTYQNQYTENKLRLQGKGQQPTPSFGAGKGYLTTRDNKDRSVTPEQKPTPDKLEEKNNRSRSTSQLAKKQQTVVPSTKHSSIMGSVEKKIPDMKYKNNTSSVTNRVVGKETNLPAAVKKVSLNMHLANQYGSQGRATPKRGSNITTPRHVQEKDTQIIGKPSHYYKKSFCQTEDETNSLINETPSERNSIRTQMTQEQTNQKIRQVGRRDDLAIAFSPNQKMNIYQTMGQLPQTSRNNLQRPTTTLKQRANTSQQEEQKDLFINNSAMPAQSTKHSNFSQSFIFDAKDIKKSTASQQQSNNGQQFKAARPASQLQKFITASSKNPSRLSSQGVTNSQPSQKISNPIPRAYQSKNEMPGDKKSKADMSTSMISNSNQNTINGTQQIKNTVLQTGGSSDGSMIDSSGGDNSPVDDENTRMNNKVRNLTVDLTYYQGK